MKKIVGAVIVLAAVALLAPVALSAAGRWLVVEDALQSARAIVVFGGHVPFRAMEAAAIYKQGFAPEVWLTQAAVHEEDVALERLGIVPMSEHEISRRVLIRSGVPEDAIRVLPGGADNTTDEVREVADQLADPGNAHVILVTSKYHTRRVTVIWHAVAPDGPDPIVRYAPGDPFQPDGWWRNTRDARSVSHEWFGLINAWSGFLVQPPPRVVSSPF